MVLTLSAEERALLLELLRSQLGDLKAEIYRTEARGFKEELKVREALLAAMLARLEATTGDADA